MAKKKILLDANDHSLKRYLIRRYEQLSSLPKPVLLVLKFAGFFASLAIFGLGGLFLVFGRDLPDVTALKSMNFSETSVIYDREGNVLYSIFGDENRKYVSLGSIAPYAIQATLAIEDKNFYQHLGFDFFGIIRAQLRNFREDDIRQGASTITQQLAKNVFLSSERTYDRKIKELLLSLQIEAIFEKDDILEMYLNKIPYGSNSYGIEAASQTFFGKSSGELSLTESAVLAALPKAPSYFSPYGQNRKELIGYCEGEEIAVLTALEEELVGEELPPEGIPAEENSEEIVAEDSLCSSPDDEKYVKGRKDFVLERMLEDGYITREQFLAGWQEGFDLSFRDPVHKIEAPHFVFYVRQLLEEKYGKEAVQNGGFEVVTSLDPKLQSLAEDLIAGAAGENLRRSKANNAAFVALDPRTGQILAMVGSVDYWNQDIDGQVNVVTSSRQPGSAFKPLIYAAAVENGGIGSGTILSDTKTVFAKNYIPKNSDNRYKGKMTARQALAQSRNIPAIKAFYLAGGDDENRILDFMNKVGVRTLSNFKNSFNEKSEERGWTFNYGPAMAIGSGELPLLELVGGYGALANGGKYMPTNAILEIRDRNGNVVDIPHEDGVQAMNPQSAYVVNNILSDVNARPAGSWRSVLTVPGHTVAAKTGTSNKKVGKVNYPNNLLTVGYTPSIAVGVWVGNTNGDPLWIGAWGMIEAAPIFKAFLTAALEGKPDEPFPVPEGVKWQSKEVFPGFAQNPKDKDIDKIFVEADPEVKVVDGFSTPPELEEALEAARNEDGTSGTAPTGGESPSSPVGELPPASPEGGGVGELPPALQNGGLPYGF